MADGRSTTSEEGLLDELRALACIEHVRAGASASANARANAYMAMAQRIASISAHLEEQWRREGSLYDHSDRANKAIIAFYAIDGFGPALIRECLRRKIWSPRDLEYSPLRDHLTELQLFALANRDDITHAIARSDVTEALRAMVAYVFASEAANTSGGALVTLELAGSYRRGAAVCGDIDIVLCAPAPAATRALRAIANADECVFASLGKKKAMMYWRCACSGTSQLRDRYARVDFVIVPADASTPEGASARAFALFYLTGSREFNIHLRSVLKSQGATLNEYGLSTKRPIRNEDDIFRAMHVPPIAPRDRSADRADYWRPLIDRAHILAP